MCVCVCVYRERETDRQTEIEWSKYMARWINKSFCLGDSQ